MKMVPNTKVFQYISIFESLLIRRYFSDPLEDLNGAGDSTNFWPQLDTPDNTTLLPTGGANTVPQTSLTQDTELFFKRYHPNRAMSSPGGENLLQSVNNDQFAQHRTGVDGNAYYPFATRDEWELVQWMTDASLTQQQIDVFLRLAYVCRSTNLCELIAHIPF